MERGQHLPQHAYRVLGEHQPTGRAVTGTVLKNIKANELIFLCVCIGGGQVQEVKEGFIDSEMVGF